MAAASGDDIDKWLDEALDQVREQAWHMKRAFDQGDVDEALKFASTMTSELRTSRLSPRNYYELFMSVTDELREMEMCVDDEEAKSTRGEAARRSIVELYEKVQHTGNIVPRLYLLITVAAVYIKSKKAPSKDILFDLVELCRGVQHPMRGLFLRNYLSQMSKDKLPDEGTQFEGVGGSVADSIEFTLQNFGEMNKLWVRMQHQGAVKDRERREKERRNLKQLVGTNLVRLSQMSGVTLDIYKETVLPRVLEQIVNCKDAIAQEYLMDCIIQVFPDDFHLQTLDMFLTTCGQLHEKVNVKDIIITLMTRLAAYANAQPDAFPADLDMFPIFHSKSSSIISSNEKMSLVDVLSLQVALVSFSSKCYPEKIDYIDQVLAFSVEHLEKTVGKDGTVDAKCVKQIVQLLSMPLDSLSLRILDLNSFGPLMFYLGDYQKKQVATIIVQAILKSKSYLDTLEKVNSLFQYIRPLIRDEEESTLVADEDRFEFDQEQHLVAQLFQLVRHEDSDMQFKLYSAVRKHFGTGGTQRIEYTLPPLIFGTFELIRRVQARETDESEEKPTVKPKKIFVFIHETIMVLNPHYPQLSLRLFLQAAQVADKCGFEPVAYEFLAQAFEVYENEITQSTEQFLAISYVVASLQKFKCFGDENYDALISKATQHCAKLLKKTDQCRAVYNCSHLFWPEDDEQQIHRDEKRVLACLQRALKIADNCMGLQVHLFVEILNKYLYFYDRKCPSITTKYLRVLINLIDNHIPTLDASETSRVAKAHYWNTLKHIRLKAQTEGEAGERYKEIGVGETETSE